MRPQDYNWCCLERGYGHLTDKFANGYGPLYAEIFEEIPSDGRILEIGVAKGGSMILWKELCPEGIIVGVDSGRDYQLAPEDVPPGTHYISCDQTVPWLLDRVGKFSEEWDLIIDDASHHGEKSEATFNMLWPHVNPGGWYVLEDFGVGVPGNEPFYGHYGGVTQLRLAQSFLERASWYDTRPDGQRSDISEFKGRPSIIAIRKRAE